MKTWHVGLALAAVAAVAWGSTAAAAPAKDDELLVSDDCSRIEVRNKAAIVARVGAVIVRELPGDDMPAIDLAVKVLRTLVPQCTWPPPAGSDPEFVSPDGSARWSQIQPIAATLTWGQVRSRLGSFDTLSPTGASPAEIAAGLSMVALLSGRTGYAGGER